MIVISRWYIAVSSSQTFPKILFRDKGILNIHMMLSNRNPYINTMQFLIQMLLSSPISSSSPSSSSSSSSSSSLLSSPSTITSQHDFTIPQTFLLQSEHSKPSRDLPNEPIADLFHHYYDDEPPEVYKGPEWYLVPLIFGIIFVVGAMGNGCLIFTVLRHKEMRTAPNYLLVSLATGDLLLILISVPFSSTIYTFDEWPYGEFVCKLNEFLVAFSLGVTVFTLTALSWERYSVIVHPIQANKRKPAFKTMTVVGVVWILAMGLATLELFAAHVSYEYAYYDVYEFLKDNNTNFTSSSEFLSQQNSQQPQHVNTNSKQPQHVDTNSQKSQHVNTNSQQHQHQHFLTQLQHDNNIQSIIPPSPTTISSTTLLPFTIHETVLITSATCDNHPKSWPNWYGRFNAMFKFLIYFALPLIIISVFYVIMAKVLFASGRYLEISASGKHGVENHRQETTIFKSSNRTETKEFEMSDNKKVSVTEESTKAKRKSKVSASLSAVEGLKVHDRSQVTRTKFSIGVNHMTKQIETRKKVARLVLSFVVVFVVCWLPRHIYSLWYRFDDAGYNMFWHVFKISGFCLSFINSCINPLAVHFLSKQFRKYYIRYFRFFCRCFSPSKRNKAALKRDDRTPGCDNDHWKNTSHLKSVGKIKMAEADGRREDEKKKISAAIDRRDDVINCISHHRRRHHHHHHHHPCDDQSKESVAGTGPLNCVSMATDPVVNQTVPTANTEDC